MSNSHRRIFAEDVTDEMMKQAFEVAERAFADPKPGMSLYSGVADRIREDFDKLHGTSWNCVVGKDFGSLVTHCTKTYVFRSGLAAHEFARRLDLIAR